MSAPVSGLVPLGVVTLTSTLPAAPAGAVMSTSVADTFVSEVPKVAPKCTAVAPLRLLPKICTRGPPARYPEFGERPNTAGAPAALAAGRPTSAPMHIAI